MKRLELKNINKITVLTSAIVIITLAIAILFIYKPFVDKNSSLKLRILEERQRNILFGKIRAIGRHLDVYNKRIPRDRDVSWLVRELSDIASKEKIEISSITPGATEDRALYSHLYVKMDFVSDYNQLGRFLSRVESSEKFMRVESIDIKRQDIAREFETDREEPKDIRLKTIVLISSVVLKE